MTEPKEPPFTMERLRELLVSRQYPPGSRVNVPLFRHYRNEILIMLAQGHPLKRTWEVLTADGRMRRILATFLRIARAQHLPTPHPTAPALQ